MSRLRALKVLPWIALTAIAALAVAAVVLLPPLFTPNLDDPQAQFEVLDRARLTVAAVIGGVGVLFGAYINWRRVSALEQQVGTAQLGQISAQRGQITERFTRAIDQLGAVRASDAPAPEIRAGGVRSLERIAGESPEDFWPILDILTAYLRSESRVPPPDVESLWERARVRVRMDVAFTSRRAPVARRARAGTYRTSPGRLATYRVSRSRRSSVLWPFRANSVERHPRRS